MDRYIGIDAHAISSTVVVVGQSGRKLSEQVVETNAKGNLNPVILPTHAAITAAVRRRSSSRSFTAKLEQPWKLSTS